MQKTIPKKDVKKSRDKMIRAFYRSGYSMDEVCAEMQRLGYSVSKTTVFFAINGRFTKKAADKRKIKNNIKKLIK